MTFPVIETVVAVVVLVVCVPALLIAVVSQL